MRGSRRTEAELKANGGYRKDRHGGSPSGDGEPRKPDWVVGVASDFWGETVPMLVRMGVAKEADGAVLGSLCMAFMRYREADDKLAAAAAAGGETYKLSCQVAAAEKAFLSIAGKFGMTPLDRMKLRVEKPREQASDWAKFNDWADKARAG